MIFFRPRRVTKMNTANEYMSIALSEAKKAYDICEVPVGAVIVKNNKIIAKGHNLCESKKDATYHAEIEVIRKASKKLNSKILDECELYVTVEPCAMCAGAIINSGIKRVYIGAEEPKTGCLGSVASLDKLFSRKPEVYFGFCENECKTLMKEFFSAKR